MLIAPFSCFHTFEFVVVSSYKCIIAVRKIFYIFLDITCEATEHFKILHNSLVSQCKVNVAALLKTYNLASV